MKHRYLLDTFLNPATVPGFFFGNESISVQIQQIRKLKRMEHKLPA